MPYILHAVSLTKYHAVLLRDLIKPIDNEYPTGQERLHMWIDGHVGGVNDLAFSHPNKQLSVITCGDDMTIKVWDAATGAKQYTFEGHEAPVYSVCPHYKENIQFIFSTALDGEIKAWLYDNLGSRVDYDGPGRWCTTMATLCRWDKGKIEMGVSRLACLVMFKP
ncbi:hypothetical protein RJ640_000837 [Escallonia rubra]|uniref:Uncharacterized protein n=1 Tax=Escallonia rubra TaxID=112253 RepID=A0AA88RK32_9ASTE|nr:hypothetical protein RJ640_000837 [Escallonia rubra]